MIALFFVLGCWGQPAADHGESTDAHVDAPDPSEPKTPGPREAHEAHTVHGPPADEESIHDAPTHTEPAHAVEPGEPATSEASHGEPSGSSHEEPSHDDPPHGGPSHGELSHEAPAPEDAVHGAPKGDESSKSAEVDLADPVVEAEPAARPMSALRSALVYLLLGGALLVGLGLASASVARRRPHLGPEIANLRFGLTLVVVLWSALSAVSAAQVGGSVVSLGGLATAVVLATAFGLWWVPRYLDGLWLVLRASQQELAWVECNGVFGQLGEVGALRVRLQGKDGLWTSVPIASFGGATIRGAASTGVRLEVDVGAADSELLRHRATVSPFRDPGEPVRLDRKTGVLSMRCWSEKASSYLEQELRALRDAA